MKRDDTARRPSPRASVVFVARVLAVAAAVGLLVWIGRELGAYVPRFAAWVDSLGVWGPLVFIAGYALATVGFVPGSLLTMAGGAIFGLAKGTLFVLCGALLGTASAFLIARYLARSWIERKLESRPRFQSIDRAVAGEGLKIVFLLRLSPAFPYNLLNYALGLTRVRFGDYLLATFGMVPATFLYVYYGKALGSLAAVAGGSPQARGAGEWTLLAVGLAATLLVTTLVTRIAKRALAQEVPE